VFARFADAHQRWEFQGELIALNPGPALFEEFIYAHHKIRDRTTHNDLDKIGLIMFEFMRETTLETTPCKFKLFIF
jgi:hypothetical protein